MEVDSTLNNHDLRVQGGEKPGAKEARDKSQCSIEGQPMPEDSSLDFLHHIWNMKDSENKGGGRRDRMISSGPVEFLPALGTFEPPGQRRYRFPNACRPSVSSHLSTRTTSEILQVSEPDPA